MLTIYETQELIRLTCIKCKIDAFTSSTGGISICIKPYQRKDLKDILNIILKYHDNMKAIDISIYVFEKRSNTKRKRLERFWVKKYGWLKE